MTTNSIFGKKNTATFNGEFQWHSHLGSNSGMVRQVGAVSADSLLVPTRARWSAWCAQICSATVVYMRTRSFDFDCLGSQSAWQSCCSPPNASNSSSFGLLMPLDRGKLSSVLMRDVGAEKHRRGNQLHDRHQQSKRATVRCIWWAVARLPSTLRSEAPRTFDAGKHESTCRRANLSTPRDPWHTCWSQ